MDSKALQNKKNLYVSVQDRRDDIEYIQGEFNIKDSITQLHTMMKMVTEKEFTAKNVNAACNCIHQLNETINTTIKAARFLREIDLD